MDNAKPIVFTGIFLLLLASCHSPVNTKKQSGNGTSGTSSSQSKHSQGGSGTHSFVPYGDKPPLGTPVETH
jgi:hypothetical protein